MELWVPGSELDRVGDQRLNPNWVKALWTSPDARLLRIGPDLTFRVAAGGAALLLEPVDDRYDVERHFLVGLVGGDPIFTVEEEPTGDAVVGRLAIADLGETHRDIAVTALALVNWHRVAPHCGVCGSMTTVRAAGHVRYCSVCERERYPRTDPAIITAIVDSSDRLLLAHNTAWPANRMSLIAGFVDAGESLEQAVRREAGEEVGLELGAVRYVASQPWPFPRSLMLGYAARAASVDITVDAVEIDRARWFTRDEYAAALASGDVGTPTPSSIASNLIGLWRCGELPAV